MATVPSDKQKRDWPRCTLPDPCYRQDCPHCYPELFMVPSSSGGGPEGKQ